MRTAVNALSWVQTAEFAAIAVVVVRLWARHRGATYAWLAATFGVLGSVVVIGRFLPTEPHGFWEGLAVRVLIVGIVLFPYMLYRFEITFQERRAWIFRLANGATAAVCIWTLLLPSIPKAGDPRSVGFSLFIAAVLVQWTGLSLLVAVRLWRMARGEPTVARRRMRTLALGAIGMTVALLVSGSSNSGQYGVIQVVSAAIVLVTVPLFLIGVSPPSVVLLQWRNADQQAMREATIGLVRALSPAEICDGLLPRVTAFMGCHGAAIVGTDGTVIGSYMLSETKLAEVRVASLERTARDDIELDNNVLWVPMSAGWLVMSTTTFTPFFGQDEARALTSIGALTDMSLSRVSLMERDRAHVEAMRDFVAIASHDLRTPSAAIAGYASLLEHKWEAMSEADKRHAVGAVNRQSKHLSRLVEDLLMTSRIDGFAIPMEPVTIDVSQCLEQVVRDVGVPGVAVTVTPALSVVMDADHFRRIITNYLRNAEVYGAAPIRVEAAAEAGEVQIRVIDHGAGVPIEFQPRLFEKFARADQKMSNATGGTGLGLSIVSGLAKAAGGSAWFAPHEPQGSVFGLTLPLPVSIPQQTPKETQWTSDESSSSSRTRLTSAG